MGKVNTHKSLVAEERNETEQHDQDRNEDPDTAGNIGEE
jgi:hypothetical protein